MSHIGRFMGARHHNQCKPVVKAFNARESIGGFISFWEGRKVKTAPNKMFTSNRRAVSCPRVEYELIHVGVLEWRFLSPMLSVMAGRLVESRISWI